MNHSTHTIDDCKAALRARGVKDEVIAQMSDELIRELCDPFGHIGMDAPPQAEVDALKGVSEDLQKVNDIANASGSPLSPEVVDALGAALLKAAGIRKDVLDAGDNTDDNGGESGGG